MPQLPRAGGLGEGVHGAGAACGLGNAQVGGSFTAEGPREMFSWLAGTAAAPAGPRSHCRALVPLQGVRVPEDPPPH